MHSPISLSLHSQSFSETLFCCLHFLSFHALTNILYANTAYVALFFGTILCNNMASIWPNVGDSFSVHFNDSSVVPDTVS